MKIVQFKNGKYGVRCDGGGMFKSPYLFLYNKGAYPQFADPECPRREDIEFDTREDAEIAMVFKQNEGPDYGELV